MPSLGLSPEAAVVFEKTHIRKNFGVAGFHAGESLASTENALEKYGPECEAAKASNRFLQRDPLGYIDGPNDYTYANNNPMLYEDPTGMVYVSAFEGKRIEYTPEMAAFEEGVADTVVGAARFAWNFQTCLGGHNANCDQLPSASQIWGGITSIDPAQSVSNYQALDSVGRARFHGNVAGGLVLVGPKPWASGGRFLARGRAELGRVARGSGQLARRLGLVGARVSQRGAIDLSRLGGARRGIQSLNISGKQFGKKLAKRARELGLDPSSAKVRHQLRGRIQRIFSNVDEVRTGVFRGQGPGGTEGAVSFFRRGRDVVVTTPVGDFVTFLPGGASNARFLSGIVVP